VCQDLERDLYSGDDVYSPHQSWRHRRQYNSVIDGSEVDRTVIIRENLSINQEASHTATVAAGQYNNMLDIGIIRDATAPQTIATIILMTEIIYGRMCSTWRPTTHAGRRTHGAFPRRP